LDLIHKGEIEKKPDEMLEKHITDTTLNAGSKISDTSTLSSVDAPTDDRTKEEVKQDDTDLYNISNFSI
jgi:hypothetical protein